MRRRVELTGRLPQEEPHWARPIHRAPPTALGGSPTGRLPPLAPTLAAFHTGRLPHWPLPKRESPYTSLRLPPTGHL